MSASIKIEGLKEVQKNLKKLEGAAKGNALRMALRKSAKPIYDAVRAKVPVAESEYVAKQYVKTGGVTSKVKGTVSPGRLKKSIRISSRLNRRGKGKTAATVSIKAGNADAFYARFVEFGTRYVQARPFMRDAFERYGSRSIKDFSKHLKLAIEKQLKKSKK